MKGIDLSLVELAVPKLLWEIHANNENLQAWEWIFQRIFELETSRNHVTSGRVWSSFLATSDNSF